MVGDSFGENTAPIDKKLSVIDIITLITTHN